MKLDQPFYTIYKNKWIKDLNVRPKAIKLLEENMGSNISDISLSNIFSDIFSWGRGTKEKNKQIGLPQTKKFLHNKGNHQQNEKTTCGMGGVFAIMHLIRGYYPKFMKKLIQLNTKKTNNPIKKWAEDLNKHFSKRTHRCSIVTGKDAQCHESSEKCKLKPQ